MDIRLRPLASSELDRLAESDRSEQVSVGYRVSGGNLEVERVSWDVPAWSPCSEGEHSIGAQIAFCREHLARGGRAIGGFDGGALVGIAIVTPEVRPGLAQLAFLHVSCTHRRAGVGRRLLVAASALALAAGADRLYVSATPSGSAVGFYRRNGFELAPEPLPELYTLEPDDIHMTLVLRSPS